MAPEHDAAHPSKRSWRAKRKGRPGHSVYYEDDLSVWLKHHAINEGVSVTGITRQLLIEYRRLPAVQRDAILRAVRDDEGGPPVEPSPTTLKAVRDEDD